MAWVVDGIRTGSRHNGRRWVRTPTSQGNGAISRLRYSSHCNLPIEL